MRITAIFLLLAGVTLLPACSQNSSDTQDIQQSAAPLNQVALKPVASCDSLKQRFVDNWVENLLAGQRFDTLIDLPGVITSVEDGVQAGAASALADSLPDIVSQTNIQETGVDEADSVKADSLGNLYIAQHDKLVIADAFPPQAMNILSTVDLGGFVSGIYLSETDNLVAAVVTPIIHIQPAPLPAAISPYIPWQQKTDLVLVDISNRSAPAISKRIRLDGSLVSSRRVDSGLHLVQAYYLNPFVQANTTDIQRLLQQYRDAFDNGNDEQMQVVRAQVRQQVMDLLNVDQARDLLPGWQELVNEVVRRQDLLQCESIFAPDIDLDNNQLLIVSSVDLSDGTIQQVAAIGSGWTTYASRDDLFIVQPGRHWWWNRDQHQQSAIHHFSIAAAQPEYVSTGLVKGYVNNSFSLSYYQDRLRVATTQNLWDMQDRSDIRSTNHLFVLADVSSGGMDVIGSVENFADNERIFAARFLQDRGFVVTFRQVDPLFAFDLADPTNPVIAGELKIPGFSTYMHPIGDSHLLTIGRDGTDTGVSNDVAIKLFDVTNLAAPVEVDSYTPALANGYSWSQATWDHHAFTYYQPEQMLSVPLSTVNSSTGDFFTGLLVLNVDPLQGLSLAGLVDHQDLLSTNCDASDPGCDVFYRRWLAQPTRSVFMTHDTDSYLYSLSNIAVKAVNTSALDLTVGSLLLPTPQLFYDVYF